MGLVSVMLILFQSECDSGICMVPGNSRCPVNELQCVSVLHHRVPMCALRVGRGEVFPGRQCVCTCTDASVYPFLGNKEDEFRMPYLSHQQLPAGILPMVPEVAQAVGVSQGHHTKDFTRAAPNPAKATVTAMIARELLYGGTSPTAETILKNNISSGHVPHGPLTRPSEQLDYLSRVQGFQVTAKPEPCSLYLSAAIFGFLSGNNLCTLFLFCFVFKICLKIYLR